MAFESVPTHDMTASTAVSPSSNLLLLGILSNLVWTAVVGCRAIVHFDNLFARDDRHRPLHFAIPLSLLVVWLSAFAFESLFVIWTCDASHSFSSYSSDFLSEKRFLHSAKYFLICITSETIVGTLLHVSVESTLRSIIAHSHSRLFQLMRFHEGLRLIINVVVALAFPLSRYVEPQQSLCILATLCGIATVLTIISLLWTPEPFRLHGSHIVGGSQGWNICNVFYRNSSLLHFAMLANAAYFVYSPSILQSIIHVVLNKVYVSCMTTVLGAASSGDSIVQLDWANVTPPEKLMLQLQAAALA